MSIIMRVTQTNRWFVVELTQNGETSRVHMLNEKSLRYDLKHRIGLDKAAVASCMHYLAQSPTPLEVDLSHTTAKINKAS